MKIAIIAIVTIAILTTAIDRKIIISLVLPKSVLSFARGVLPVRLIYHMMGFHSILIFMKIAIIAIGIIAIVIIAIVIIAIVTPTIITCNYKQLQVRIVEM